jgi:hypothetical protein
VILPVASLCLSYILPRLDPINDDRSTSRDGFHRNVSVPAPALDESGDLDMLLDEFGEEFVFALQACLPVGDSPDSEKRHRPVSFLVV